MRTLLKCQHKYLEISVSKGHTRWYHQSSHTHLRGHGVGGRRAVEQTGNQGLGGLDRRVYSVLRFCQLDCVNAPRWPLDDISIYTIKFKLFL